MKLLTATQREGLRANALAREAALAAGAREPDSLPVVRLFAPSGAATWLASELDDDGDTLFGLADMGFGYPELGAFSLAELTALRVPPFGLPIERDLHFRPHAPLSVYAEAARRTGSLAEAERLLAFAARTHARRGSPPSPDPDRSDG